MNIRSLLDALAPPLCAGCGANAGATEPLCSRCRRELRWLGPEPVALGAVVLPGRRSPTRARPAAWCARSSSRARAARQTRWPPRSPRTRRRGGSSRTARSSRFRSTRHARASAATTRPGCSPRRSRSAPALARRRLPRARGPEGHPGSGATRAAAHRDRRAASGSSPGEPPENAVLVDDVITTGRDARRVRPCAAESGTAEVRAVAYARTPGR